ncbi:MAG: KH domain-containing protein [Candidatus Nanoarchaeia archaeon]
MDFMYELKIPRERIAVLIGKKGEIKKEIEQQTKAKIFIDSEEGFVRLSGNDGLSLFTCKEIVKAIARGFNPEIARLLFRTDYTLVMINVEAYTSKSRKSMQRLRGRVIGSDGKSRKTIEQLTETYISVYGKTIGIIGETAHVEVAKAAVEDLLNGAMHASTYRWLEKKQKDIAIKERF